MTDVRTGAICGRLSTRLPQQQGHAAPRRRGGSGIWHRPSADGRPGVAGKEGGRTGRSVTRRPRARRRRAQGEAAGNWRREGKGSWVKNGCSRERSSGAGTNMTWERRAREHGRGTARSPHTPRARSALVRACERRKRDAGSAEWVARRRVRGAGGRGERERGKRARRQSSPPSRSRLRRRVSACSPLATARDRARHASRVTHDARPPERAAPVERAREASVERAGGDGCGRRRWWGLRRRPRPRAPRDSSRRRKLLTTRTSSSSWASS